MGLRWWGGQLIRPRRNVCLRLWLERPPQAHGFMQGPMTHICPRRESEVITDLGARRPGF